MRKFLVGIAAAALIAAPVAPATALTIRPASPIAQASDNLVEIRHRKGHRVWKRDGRYGRWSRGSRHHHRWKRHRHRGHHDHDDWWWGPAAGFGLGLMLGAAPRYYEYPVYRTAPRVGVNAAHIAWCHDRYRSYRAWDNTFKPYHGPRRQCNSPYY